MLSPQTVENALPPQVAACIWRGTQLATGSTCSVASGWQELDDALPSGGWPLRGVTEVLAAQPATLEWRLLAPALRSVTAAGREIVVIGPPRHPCMAGLRCEGIDDRRLIWVRAEHPAERLWAAEQLIRSASAGAVLAWLPHVRAEQVRRLQVCAQGTDALVFLFRPELARREASAAPLRVSVSFDPDWSLTVDIFKRPGSPVDRVITLDSVPGGLQSVMTTRMRRPSTLPGGRRWNTHALGLPAAVANQRVAANGA